VVSDHLHRARADLIIFTVLAQMAVGAFVALVAFGLLTRGQAGGAVAEALGMSGLLAIGVSLGGAAIAASFHLDRPAGAHHVLQNLRSSWLSREVVLGFAFGAAFVTYAGACSLGLWSTAARDALGVASVLVGLALVGAMSRIYMLRTVPAWNAAATPISFYTTTFLLGALGLGAHLALAGAHGAGGAARDLVGSVVGWIAVVGVALVAVALVTTYRHGMRLRRMGGAAAESFEIVFHSLRALLVTRVALALAGVGIFALFAVWSFPGVAVLGFAMVLGAEILGRLLFFAAHRRVGL
jgi:anaerobic dimethyl sulfoxide reductase subunit C (anchor subunit)